VVEAAGKPGDEARLVAALEVGGPEVVIVLVVAQHVVGGGEHGGGHRDNGLHRPAALLEAQELGAQVPLAASHRGPGALNEHGLEPRRPFAEAGGAVLARTRVLARTQARLGNQVPHAGEAGHVRADLRDEDLCCRRAHAGDRHEVGHGGATRDEGGADCGV
jgi:hypothetical protein